MAELHFRLDARSPAKRRLGVVLEADRELLVAPGTAAAAAAIEVELFLPVWTPGSYLVREYARHLGPVRARDLATGASLPCGKSSKNRIRLLLPAGVQRIGVEYDVYAHELSVRTADLTADHAYWNHACILLWPVGRGELAARLAVRLPDGWDVACSLPAAPRAGAEVELRAPDLDAVLDAPLLAGRFRRLDWTVRGVPHSLALDGLGAVAPPESLLPDLTRVVECAADVFGGTLPYDRFLFQCLFTGSGHGGLEHAASTTLLAARTALQPGKHYREFVALAAHELFHCWNGKRMRPAEFWRYDYERENYTSMLWLVEGATAYYDDLLCRRAGVFSPTDYLAALAKNLNALKAGPGRLRQSLSEASFDAWIRLYRPDENTRNATQNYYGNGAIAVLLLDLTIRRETGGRRSFDDVLRALYRRSFEQGRGYTRADLEACLSDAAGTDLAPLLRTAVDEPFDPDLRELLAAFGIELQHKDAERPFVGMSLDETAGTVTFVTDGGPAHAAGVAPGDELLAVDGLRVTGATWGDVYPAVARAGRPLRLLVATRGLLRELELVPAAPVPTFALHEEPGATDPIAALRRGWVGE